MFVLLPYRVEETDERRPCVTWALVALNAAVFAATLLAGEEGRQIAFLEYGFVPEEPWRWYTWLTYMFLHGGWLHIMANMFFLLVFGGLVEGRLGRLRFLAFYLICGVLAAAAHMWTVADFFSDEACIGASGAVSGVLGAVVMLAPRAKVRCFYLWVPMMRPLLGVVGIPAVVFLGVWFLGQLIFAFTFSGLSVAVEVAYWAHIGGFVAGALLAGGGRIPGALGRLARVWARRGSMRKALGAAAGGDFAEAAGIIASLHSDGVGADALGLLQARLYCAMGNKGRAAALGLAEFRRAAAAKDRGRVLDAWFLSKAAGGEKELVPHDYLVAARSLAEFGRDDEAAGVLLEALERFEENEHADAMLFELGEIGRRLGRGGHAADVFSLLTKLFPDSQFARSVEWRR